jgi:hypothetical protein
MKNPYKSTKYKTAYMVLVISHFAVCTNSLQLTDVNPASWALGFLDQKIIIHYMG